MILLVGAACGTILNDACSTSRAVAKIPKCLDVIELWTPADDEQFFIARRLCSCKLITDRRHDDSGSTGSRARQNGRGLEYTFLVMLIPLLIASALAIPAYFTYQRNVATAAASVKRIQTLHE